ncbi:cobalt ABC transporter ATP-binding protein [filamentous cyanobacterium CCP2]|nr:cobalt ABC transporter ATP-binding protein [filamentous cyanobacterium CCP2]
MFMEFENVNYTYRGSRVPALQNLTLRIPTGKRCALIGQNGCGKTTLFLLANGLYQPQKGTIRWHDRPLRYDRSSLMQLRQQVGLVFQDPEQQLVASTVEEDISYGLYNLGLPTHEVARRVQQALIEFKLTELAGTPVHHLSLGQKKRVAIADVMVLRPQLLLLDEPTAYLDPRQTRNLLKLLDDIQTTGTTVFIATHDLDFVYCWADWVMVMDQGQLVMEGTPQSVFAQRQIMEDLELGIPTLLELLAKLSDPENDNYAYDQSAIGIEKLQRQILKSLKCL